MEAIALGIAIGAGAVLALRNGRANAKKVVGWASRQAGWISGQVNRAVESTRRVSREEYTRGREENLAKTADMPEIPPASTRPVPVETQAQPHANGTTHQPS
jgi:hypothetical protein